MSEPAGEPMQTGWHIQLLGELQARHGDQVITRFRTRKTGQLLACLACRLRRSHRREELMEQLWPESDPVTARTQLRNQIYLLRRLLEPPGTPAGTVLVADRTSLCLNPAGVTTDVSAFEGALSAAKQAEGSRERVTHLTQAVELYRGELLPGCFEDWVQQERQWLAERYFQALGELLSHLERASEFECALEYARRGVSADPLREEAHRAVIRLLAAVGQPAAALRQYQELERLLKEQLGSTPEAATRALVREVERLAVLRQAPSAAARLPSTHAAYPTGELPLIGEGENRLVTLLFADMSRSLETTRDLHPEDAAALVNRLLQAMVDGVLKYEGRIDRFQDDGVLAVFGVPRAHEDDPERAIQAALAIRAAAHHLELEVSAGIHTGEVYVGPVGTARHQELTVMGPAVGLAARLQERAGAGQIVVGEVTQHLARRAFAFTPLSLGIKGLTHPIPVYRVEGALVRPEKARGIEGLRAALIGRDEELAKLQAALEAVRQGRGQVVTLIGEAGVGKSRLVAELKAAHSSQLTAHGSDEDLLKRELCTVSREPPSPLWLEGRCLELNMTAGYSLFVDLFREYFAWRPDESDEARGVRLAACLEEFVARQELTAERAEEMGPLLGRLLSVCFGSDWDERLKNAGPEQVRHQTFLAVRDFLLALARRQPLVLVLEDLHWADSLSLDLISLLLEALPLAPLLLLCVYRPEKEHKCWHLGTITARKCPERSTEIPLRELSPEQSGLLVESLLTIENLPAAVKELILEKSRGNPFFVEEVVRSLIAAGMLYRHGETWRARAGIDTIRVPESIQSVIRSRVDRLRPELQQILQSAAVIGRLFRPRLLEQVRAQGSGVGGQQGGPVLTPDPWALTSLLWELEEQELIYQERVVPEEEYSFQHVLTQETNYQSLLRQQRAVLHHQVGEAIESLYRGELEEQYEQLAYHYERSEADDKAVQYLLKAGEKSRQAYLNEVAIGCFQRALERLDKCGLSGSSPSRICDQQESRLAALKGLAQLYLGVGRIVEAEEKSRQAIVLAKEMGLPARDLVRLYSALAEALWWQGRLKEMSSIGEEGLALLGDDTESVEAALMNDTIAMGGNSEQWREFTYRSVPFIGRLSYSAELRPVYSHIYYVYKSDRNLDEAIKWLRSLERQAQQHHDLTALGEMYRYTGELLIDQGDLRGGVCYLRRALEQMMGIGDAKHQGMYECLIGSVLLSLGDLDEASEYEERAARTFCISRSKGGIARGHMVRGTLRLCQGLAGEAVEAFEKAAQIFQEYGDPLETRAALFRGRVYLTAGYRQKALTLLQELAAREQADPWELAAALSSLEVAHGAGETFRGICRCIHKEHPMADSALFAQWFLELAAPHPFSRCQINEDWAATPSSEWLWQDPFGDGSFAVQNGLEVRAANGRDLQYLNLSAPRLLHAASGDFAAQAIIPASPSPSLRGRGKARTAGGRAPGVPVSASGARPAIGGILLWKDNGNYLRLERGTRGNREVSFQGSLSNKDLIIGRGLLPSDRLFLRLERLGTHVRALCSANGHAWFSVGHAEFPVEDPLEVGLHAIGNIDRTVYPGAHPEGTAIRFQSFGLWGC